MFDGGDCVVVGVLLINFKIFLKINKLRTSGHAAKEHVEDVLGAHVVLVKLMEIAALAMMVSCILNLGSFRSIPLVMSALVIVGED